VSAVDATQRGAWSYLGSLVAQRRNGILLALLSGLTWQGAAIVSPLLAAAAIDSILAHDRHRVYLWAALAVGLGLLEAIGGAFRHIFAMRNRAYALAAVRDDLLRHSLRLDARFHDRYGSGELMSRASNDAELISRLLDASGHTFGYLITVLGAGIVLLVLDAGLALLILAPLPLLSYGFWRYSRRYLDRTTALQEELGHASSLVEETVSGIRVVKGLGAGDALSARFKRTSDRVLGRALDVASVDAVFLPALELLPMLDLLLVLWVGGHRVLDGRLTLGQFVAFNAYVVMLVWPLRILGQRVSTLQNSAAASSRVVEVLNEGPTVIERADPRPLPRRDSAEVWFEDVRFGYGGAPVLDGFTLRIEPGTSVALVGSTGSGKSTVAALLARFYDVEAGAVLLDGLDVRDAALRDLRAAVAVVAEDTFLFGDSVRANVAYGRADAPSDEVEQAARAAGAHEFILALPDGYDTVLGERGFSLSGGQRQRIAIARAILADPSVLILDDATSSVDATKEHEIRAALARVMEGRTTIVIAHRPATIALARRVVVLEGGRIVEEGSHEQLARTSRRYRELLALEDA
jgi:ATP-binding cassette, subfamily B, bacterial